MITFLVVGLVVGAAAGVGVGFVMFGGDKDTEYWFYLDFNGEDSDFDGEWISAKGADAMSAFEKAAKNNNMSYKLNEYGYIDSIDGVANDTNFWMDWGWTATTTDDTLWAWKGTSGMNTTIMNWIYIGYTEYSGMEPDIDPNNLSGWKNAGPFKA